jgi:hypothetical protein
MADAPVGSIFGATSITWMVIGAYHLNTKVPITKCDLAEAADAQGDLKCVCYILGLQNVTPGVELAGESSG